jgi:DNA-directed RNA polymerase subunit alpha
VLIAQRPLLSEESVSEYRSRFVIEPLEPGFGYTLGNSLRRTLLSSIPGAAVTSIRVDGVLHEFSTIPGVKEDVTEIILNIKDLVVSSEHDEPVVMYLRKTGAGAITAADIAPPAGVEIHNPDLHIATLNDKGSVEMELTVERGRGYVSAQQNKTGNEEIGRIPVDSIYSPVLAVTYKVEATRVEQRTDFDRLIVDVETKKSMAPRDALASAGKTLVELFGLARELNVEAEGIDMGPTPDRRRSSPRTWPCRSRTWTCPSGPTTASSARASTPSASSSPAARPTCSTSATSARSRSTRSRPSSSAWACSSRTARPGSTRQRDRRLRRLPLRR